MNTPVAEISVTLSLLAALWLGARLRRLLPDDHLNAETKKTIQMAMGLVATMAALVLGLLVSSAKNSYDTIRGEVLQMAAKVAFLDRVLAAYGAETEAIRSELHAITARSVGQMWTPRADRLVQLASHAPAGDNFYAAIHNLSPSDDNHRGLKQQAISMSADLGQLRTLLVTQSVPSISLAFLVVVVTWLFLILLSFSLLAPANLTARLSLTIAALSVSSAILLILELDRPLDGLLRIPSDPIVRALNLNSPGLR